MSQIKKAWITTDNKGNYTLCIRQNHGKPFSTFTIEVPPIEPINGRKISLTEARDLEIQENHLTIAILDHDDLVKLKEALNGF